MNEFGHTLIRWIDDKGIVVKERVFRTQTPYGIYNAVDPSLLPENWPPTAVRVTVDIALHPTKKG